AVPIFHVAVEHLRAALDLLPRHRDRFVEPAFLDQLAEPGATGHVGALADVDEVALRRDHQRLQAAEAGMAGQGRSVHAASPARGGLRGGTPRTASAIAPMCAGVVPQQPPTRLSSPARANSPSTVAMSEGDSS